MGVSKNRPAINMDDLGGNPLFSETSIYKNDLRFHHLEKKHTTITHVTLLFTKGIHLPWSVALSICWFYSWGLLEVGNHKKSEIPTADMELHRDPNRQEEMLQIKSTKYPKNNQMHVNTEQSTDSEKIEFQMFKWSCLAPLKKKTTTNKVRGI